MQDFTSPLGSMVVRRARRAVLIHGSLGAVQESGNG